MKSKFPAANIKHNTSLKGYQSKTSRQADILVKENIAGKNIILVGECKCFNKKIDVKTIDNFISFLEDIHANAGIFFTNIGYSPAAKNRATQRE